MDADGHEQVDRKELRQIGREAQIRADDAGEEAERKEQDRRDEKIRQSEHGQFSVGVGYFVNLRWTGGDIK